MARRSPGWVPNQHGAWAMLLLPLLVGALGTGPTWAHLLLAAAWTVAYLAFFATGLWLRARMRARYRPPVLVYGAGTAVLGAALLVVDPPLVRWAPVYLPLLAASLWFSWRRQDRSWANDVVTVVAACLMAVVAHELGRPPTGRVLGHPEAWGPAAVLLAYFLGTVLYVKTMIRERGNRPVLAVSIGYHAALAVVAWWVSPWLGVVAVVAAARAALVPVRWPRARPATIGAGEIGVSVALGLVLLLGW